jgi:cytochrome c556
MAYRIAAIAEVAHAKPPEKEDAKKKEKAWMQWSGDMGQAALGLADAAKSKKPADVKTAAAKLNTACNTCHGVFRDE